MPKRNRRLLRGAEEYAEVAVKEAERAKSNGSFGVGGLIVDDKGNIWKSVANSVIKNNSIFDSTAHVERQLVDWYFLAKKKKGLPPTSKMTIVVSLDPCVMCSGAILAGGFNVIHISQDSQAGITCKGFDFPTLPAGLRQEAKETFAAIGVEGKRPFRGSSHSIFYDNKIDIKLDQRSIHAFYSSLEKINKIVNNHHNMPSQDKLINPITITKSSSTSSSSSSSHLRIAKLLKKYNPKVFSKEYIVSFDRAGISLGHILITKAKESYRNTGIFNSACLVDAFGNVLLLEGSAENALSPIRTPFLELVRKYHRLLFEAGPEGNKYFAHLKYCKSILLLGPRKDSKSLMEAGSFGASIEGELPKNPNDRSSQLQYVIQRQDPHDLKDMLDNLPPLYSKTIRISNAISEVRDVELQDFCRSKASEYFYQ